MTTDVVKPSPQVICRPLGDGGVLVHLETNQIYELNTTGYRIWELLGAGLDPAAIREQLHQEFSVDGDRLDRELTDVLDGLAAAQLIIPG